MLLWIKITGGGYVSEVGPRLRLQREIEEPQLLFLTRVLSFLVKKTGGVVGTGYFLLRILSLK